MVTPFVAGGPSRSHRRRLEFANYLSVRKLSKLVDDLFA